MEHNGHMTTTRTDIHRAASGDFDPQAYDLAWFSDTHPEDGNAAETRAFQASLRHKNIHAAVTSSHTANPSRCTHCGASIRYGALLIHILTSEYLFVGEQCLDNRFSLAQDEFRRLRAQAAAKRERRSIAERVASFASDHPAIAELADETASEAIRSSEFLTSLRMQVRAGKALSVRQIEAAETAIVRTREWVAKDKAEQAARADAPPKQHLGEVGDSIEIEGKIKYIDRVEGYYGSYQWFVIIETAKGSAKFYSTAKWVDDVSRDDVVKITAKVKKLETYRDEPSTLITRAKRV